MGGLRWRKTYCGAASWLVSICIRDLRSDFLNYYESRVFGFCEAAVLIRAVEDWGYCSYSVGRSHCDNYLPLQDVKISSTVNKFLAYNSSARKLHLYFGKMIQTNPAIKKTNNSANKTTKTKTKHSINHRSVSVFVHLTPRTIELASAQRHVPVVSHSISCCQDHGRTHVKYSTRARTV